MLAVTPTDVPIDRPAVAILFFVMLHFFATATLKELWSPDAAGGDYRDEMAVATYAVQVASTVARELQEELCDKGAIR